MEKYKDDCFFCKKEDGCRSWRKRISHKTIERRKRLFNCWEWDDSLIINGE